MIHIDRWKYDHVTKTFSIDKEFSLNLFGNFTMNSSYPLYSSDKFVYIISSKLKSSLIAIAQTHPNATVIAFNYRVKGKSITLNDGLNLYNELNRQLGVQLNNQQDLIKILDRQRGLLVIDGTNWVVYDNSLLTARTVVDPNTKLSYHDPLNPNFHQATVNVADNKITYS